MSTLATEKQDFPVMLGGEWVRTEGRRTIRLPFDGTPFGETYEADATTTERAVTAAQAGASAMADLTAYERAERLDGMRRLSRRPHAVWRSQEERFREGGPELRRGRDDRIEIDLLARVTRIVHPGARTHGADFKFQISDFKGYFPHHQHLI